jgi:hypothetical protein
VGFSDGVGAGAATAAGVVPAGGLASMKVVKTSAPRFTLAMGFGEGRGVAGGLRVRIVPGTGSRFSARDPRFTLGVGGSEGRGCSGGRGCSEGRGSKYSEVTGCTGGRGSSGGSGSIGGGGGVRTLSGSRGVVCSCGS